jgi:hypothetical protein
VSGVVSVDDQIIKLGVRRCGEDVNKTHTLTMTELRDVLCCPIAKDSEGFGGKGFGSNGGGVLKGRESYALTSSELRVVLCEPVARVSEGREIARMGEGY